MLHFFAISVLDIFGCFSFQFVPNTSDFVPVVLIPLCFMRKDNVPNSLKSFEGFFKILEIVPKDRTRMVTMTF